MHSTRQFRRSLGHAKEAVPLLAAVLAVLYGIGWAMRYQSVASLGVGPLAVTREAAVAATTATLLGILPAIALSGLLEWANSRRVGPALRYWLRWSSVYLLLALLMGWLLFVLLTQVVGAPTELFAGVLAFVAVQATLVPAAFLGRAISGEGRGAWLVLGPLLALVLGTIFARSLLPRLPESFGGLGRSRVSVALKDPPLRIVGTVAAADERHTIFVRVERGGERVPALRVPNERIVEVAAVVGE